MTLRRIEEGLLAPEAIITGGFGIAYPQGRPGSDVEDEYGYEPRGLVHRALELWRSLRGAVLQDGGQFAKTLY